MLSVSESDWFSLATDGCERVTLFIREITVPELKGPMQREWVTSTHPGPPSDLVLAPGLQPFGVNVKEPGEGEGSFLGWRDEVERAGSLRSRRTLRRPRPSLTAEGTGTVWLGLG